MTAATSGLNDTVLALRQAFDLSFAQAPRTEVAQHERLLAIRMAGAPYAIRVAEIGGIYVDRRIMPLPTPLPQLLGVAGFRGQIAPVYDLASLCGYARAPSTRWLVLMRSAEPVALAFEGFDMHFSVASEHIASMPDQGLPQHRDSRALFSEAARSDEIVRPIIRLQSVLQEIHAHADSFIQKTKGHP